MRPRITTLPTMLAVLLLTAPFVGDAQQAGKVYRIGLFHVGLDHVPPSWEPLREGLRMLGYDSGTVPVLKVANVMEGKNIRLDWRNVPDEAAGHETALEFVRQRVDLIVAFENQTVRAVRAVTSEVPVVFLHGRADVQARAGHQPQDRQGHRPHHPAGAAAAGGSGDRVMDKRHHGRGWSGPPNTTPRRTAGSCCSPLER